MEPVTAQYFIQQKDTLSLQSLFEGLMKYTDSLLSSLPQEFTPPQVPFALESKIALQQLADEGEEALEFRQLEHHITLLEQIEIAYEQWKFENEQHSKDVETEHDLQLLMEHPEQIQGNAILDLEQMRKIMKKIISTERGGVLYTVYQTLTYLEVVIIGIAIARTALLLTGQITGTYGWYVLFVLGIIASCIFVLRMTKHFWFLCVLVAGQLGLRAWKYIN